MAASLPQSYPHAERVKARAGFRRIDHIADVVRDCLVRDKPLPAAYVEPVRAITKTDDRATQLNVLETISDTIKEQHIGRLTALAKHDFGAFCEVINPEEPPESPFHVWLTDLLQEIEMDPDMNKLVLNVPPGHAKPLHISTPVLTQGRGRIRLDAVRVGDQVMTHAGRWRAVTAVHQQGILPLLRITTAQGREVRSAPDHPFWVVPAEGGVPIWVKAEDLRPGDTLVVETGPAEPGHVPYDVFDARERSIEQAFATVQGYFATAGALSFQKPKTAKTPSPDARLSSSSKEVLRRMKAAMDVLALKMSVCRVSSQMTHVARISAEAFRLIATDASPETWFTYKPEDRRAPTAILTADDPIVAAFLSAAFDIRGGALGRVAGRNFRVSHRSARLLEDLQHLIHRLGGAAVLDRPDPDFGGNGWLILDQSTIETLQAKGVVFPDQAKIKPLGPRAVAATHARDKVAFVEADGEGECRCLTVEEDHSFTAGDLVVHNSTYASRLFVAWRLGRDPNQRIIGGGHSQNFVENEFSKAIKDIVEAPNYRSVFPDVQIAVDTKAKSQWAIAGKKGKYVARGVGQGIHGFRATFICVDDPYSKIEDANSAVYRKRVEQWFDADIGSRALPGCKIFVIMTRFHGEDLTHHLKMQNEELDESKKWRIIAVPAICFDPETDLMGRALGEVLWSYYDHEYFKEAKIKFGHLGFALTYQQIDTAASPDSVASKFQYYDVLPYKTEAAIDKAIKDGHPENALQAVVPPHRSEYIARTIISVDTAAKKTERSDYTVVQCWMEGRNGRHYLVDQVRKKLEYNEMASAIERMAIKWNADLMLVEDKGQGTAYIQNRGATAQQKRLAPCPIIPINPGVQGKVFRFDEVTPLIADGIVYLPKDSPWKDTLLVELGQFPDGAHDDQIDALSQYLQYAKKTGKSRFGSRKIGSKG